MKPKNIKQAVHVGRHVADLMQLSCVEGCAKKGNGEFTYLFHNPDDPGPAIEVHEGQWLVENYDGDWEVCDEEQLFPKSE